MTRRSTNFNPRSPHRERLITVVVPSAASPFHPRRSLTGSDPKRRGVKSPSKIFQSTLPSQGATSRGFGVIWCEQRFQSTLPSQGATLQSIHNIFRLQISIHAPLTGSDLAAVFHRSTKSEFQSTLPSQGATRSYRWMTTI